MRTTLFLLGALCASGLEAACLSVPADTATLCCIYRHDAATKDLSDSPVTVSTVAVLEVGETFARYGDFSAYDGPIPEHFSTALAKDDPSANDGVTVWQNLSATGALTVREALLPNFYVYEEQPELRWTMSAAEDSVLGYRCLCASTTYAGRTWTVSFAPDVPAPYGPWKLFGLPGLVLKAASADGVHSFTAVSLFRPADRPLRYEENETDVAVKRHRFISLRNRLKTDLRWAENAGYYMNKADFKSITIVKPGNKYGATPQAIVNGISLPPNCSTGWRFQPLELR